MVCALAPPRPRRCPPGCPAVALPGTTDPNSIGNGPPSNHRQQLPTTTNEPINHQSPWPDSTKPQSLYPIAPDPNGNTKHHYLMSNTLFLITIRYGAILQLLSFFLSFLLLDSPTISFLYISLALSLSIIPCNVFPYAGKKIFFQLNDCLYYCIFLIIHKNINYVHLEI